MYNFEWDKATGGYKLTTQTGRFIANEIRPVFANELLLAKLDERFIFDKSEMRPLLWAKKNEYLVNGEKVAQLNNTQYGFPLSPEFFFSGKMELKPVDIEAMIEANTETIDVLVADVKRRIKELYDADISRCNIAYIAFSGGKDSVALLDICHRVLPLSVPVIFSDTDMELPDTYDVWGKVQDLYPNREFILARAGVSAIENWRCFGPPSRTIRWCCSVHKSTPALMFLKRKLKMPAIKAMAFVGVRGDESRSRSFYEDWTDGAKNTSQINCMPILDWGAHELWLYIFANNLLINHAYKKGMSRVGCLLCPESSQKHIWFANNAYPNLLKSYFDIVIETSNKNFTTTKDKAEFIGSVGWSKRRSGAVLKDTLLSPFADYGSLSATFESPHFIEDTFFEWLKTIGTVTRERESNRRFLQLPNSLDINALIDYRSSNTGGGIATFRFSNTGDKQAVLPLLRDFLKKATACVNCRSCEANCNLGAISSKENKMRIDTNKCTRCKMCYETNNSCWRYKSMMSPEKTQSKSISINNYQKFGLRERDGENWVSKLVELGDTYFPHHANHPFGKPKVNAARSWFTQAMLIYSNTKKITPLVEIFRKNGGESVIGWEFIWMALVNNADIVKWFVTATEKNEMYTLIQLSEMLSNDNPTLEKVTIDGGIASLRDMFTKSPLGDKEAVTSVVTKGSKVIGITRKAKDIKSLTILFGLYMIACKIERGVFTIRELLSAGSESEYISPIVAFGISPDTFKTQCEGLRSKYPDYIETTFTFGLDGLTVYPDKFTTEDIIKLALEE